MIETGALVLFHCSGGKDRTGMTAALLLALGLDPFTVLEDFAKTEYYLADFIEKEVDRIDREHPEYPGAGKRVRPVYQALPDYIEAFLSIAKRIMLT